MDLIVAGREALRKGDAAQASQHFTAALANGESGNALEGLAEAVYLGLDYPAATRLYERAYTAYRAGGALLDAARVARTIAYQSWLHGDFALVNGWISLARRSVEESGEDSVERHWVDLFMASVHPNLTERERGLRDIAARAREIGEPNLLFDALSLLGQLLVTSGRPDEGNRALDEALAAVSAGAVSEYVVVEGAFCCMFSSCELTRDVARAEQWLRAADELGAHRGISSLSALCRTYYAGLLITAGRWDEAESHLTESAAALERGYDAARTRALVRLALLRLGQGRLEDAAELLAGLESDPEAAEPWAGLHLARGETDLALEQVTRGLAAGHEMQAGALLSLSVETCLANGKDAEARGAVIELEALAERLGGQYLPAAAAFSRGLVLRARGDADAPAAFRVALAGFTQARMPFDRARASFALARALADAQPDVAIAEARSALDSFEQIGAMRQADEAAAFLRALGVQVRTGQRGDAALTKRETEVLDLLGRGLSNPEISERLVISRKTVEHHVSSILMKLGLRNRAEATAHAVRLAAIVDR